jgi:hypothetical protein
MNGMKSCEMALPNFTVTVIVCLLFWKVRIYATPGLSKDRYNTYAAQNIKWDKEGGDMWTSKWNWYNRSINVIVTDCPSWNMALGKQMVFHQPGERHVKVWAAQFPEHSQPFRRKSHVILFTQRDYSIKRRKYIYLPTWILPTQTKRRVSSIPRNGTTSKFFMCKNQSTFWLFICIFTRARHNKGKTFLFSRVFSDCVLPVSHNDKMCFLWMPFFKLGHMRNGYQKELSYTGALYVNPARI